jgi:hypothetical protein
MLLSVLLAGAGAVAADLNRVHPPCLTGPDLAVAIRSGRADCGIATRAAACGAGLAFIPLLWENFDLLMRQRTYFQPSFQALLGFLTRADFSDRAAELTGYDVSPAGKIRFFKIERPIHADAPLGPCVNDGWRRVWSTRKTLPLEQVHTAAAGSSEINLAFYDVIEASSLRRDNRPDEQLSLPFQALLIDRFFYRLLRGHAHLLEELAHGDVEGVGFQYIRDHIIASNRVDSKATGNIAAGDR